jgi:hypothetical protein
MHGLEFGSEIASKHAPLVQRAAAVVGALGQGVSVVLRDAGDAAVTATSAISIT